MKKLKSLRKIPKIILLSLVLDKGHCIFESRLHYTEQEGINFYFLG